MQDKPRGRHRRRLEDRRQVGRSAAPAACCVEARRAPLPETEHFAAPPVAVAVSGRLRGLASRCLESQVLDVVDGLVEEDGDVVVVECVDGLAALPLPDDEAELAEHAQLV